ncbi:MAG TPA: hypothetical protein VLO31_01805 [Cryobacterium sp.]|nr:hypothetical protein [Cryobacterium sp.]
MFTSSETFSSFSVGDIDKAKRFYGETLGLSVTDPAANVLAVVAASM